MIKFTCPWCHRHFAEQEILDKHIQENHMINVDKEQKIENEKDSKIYIKLDKR